MHLSSPIWTVVMKPYLGFPLQLIQNSTARLLTLATHLSHTHPFVWHIQSQILLLTHKSLHALAPQYLSELLYLYRPSWDLCSSANTQLFCSRSKFCTVGDLASNGQIKSLTFLFKLAFNPTHWLWPLTQDCGFLLLCLFMCAMLCQVLCVYYCWTP